MTNIFLFRHGNVLNSDSDSERLSSEGMEQAQKAGELVGEKINALYLQLSGSSNIGELVGVLKVHSGRSRTHDFLKTMSEVAESLYQFGNFGLYGELISVKSPKIYDTSEGSKKIRQIIEQCSPMCGIQFIVGHNPGVARVARKYVSEDFSFEGDTKFLEGTLEGGGYYINTLEKTVQSINQ